MRGGWPTKVGRFVLESFNTRHGARVDRQREAKEDRKRKGIFRMIGIVGAPRDAKSRGVDSVVFKWGGH